MGRLTSAVDRRKLRPCDSIIWHRSPLRSGGGVNRSFVYTPILPGSDRGAAVMQYVFSACYDLTAPAEGLGSSELGTQPRGFRSVEEDFCSYPLFLPRVWYLPLKTFYNKSQEIAV